MAQTCNHCNTATNVVVPLAVHESDMVRAERQGKRQWIVILVLIAALVFSNLAWIIYESQYLSIGVEQDADQHADNGDISFVGGDYNGTSESADAD